MPAPNQPRNPMERFNAWSSTLITFFSNVKFLLVAAVAVVGFGVGMMSEGGRAAIKSVYCRMGGFGVECIEYRPVTNRHDPAVSVAVEAILAETGLEADVSELTIHRISDDEKTLRWERDGRRLTYHIENDGGVWVYSLLSAE